MNKFLEGISKPEDVPVRRFGYVISAIILVVSVVALVKNWPSLPLLVLAMMYFLTGALWIPVLVKPFFLLLGPYKKWFDPEKNLADKDYFGKN